MRRATGLCLALLATSQAQAAGSIEEALNEVATSIIGSLPEDAAPTLAISTFTHSGNTCSDLSNYASEIMLPTVQSVGGSTLRIYARSQLSAIFRELQLVYDGTISPGAAQQIGQISGVEAILTATITPFGEQMMVIATLIATSDGGVLGSASASFPITGTVEGLTSNQSAAACGFTGSANAPSATAAASDSATSPPSETSGPSLGTTTFTSDVFEAGIVTAIYDPTSGRVAWSLRFRNISETPISLSYLPESLVLADGQGGMAAIDGPVAGLRTCQSTTNTGYCNGTYPQYSTTLPPGGVTQMNFATKGAESLSDPRLTLSLELVVVPDVTAPENLDVRQVTFFDVAPVSR